MEAEEQEDGVSTASKCQMCFHHSGEDVEQPKDDHNCDKDEAPPMTGARPCFPREEEEEEEEEFLGLARRQGLELERPS